MPDAQLPIIASDGDSVVVVVDDQTSPPCSSMPTVVAGLRGQGLVVTVSRNPKPCRPGVMLAQHLPYRIAVREVPPGTQSVRVVLRLVTGNDATYATLATGAINLR